MSTWQVIKITEDRDGLETAELHEEYDHEASADAECERMNHEFGEASLYGTGDSVHYIVFEEAD